MTSIEVLRRGHGLGRRLLQTFEVAAMRLGGRTVSLAADEAKDFYPGDSTSMPHQARMLGSGSLTAAFSHEEQPCLLRYRIACDAGRRLSLRGARGGRAAG